MFTWICPKCGAEVPPSYSECPRCSEPAQAAQPLPEAPAPPVTAPLPLGAEPVPPPVVPAIPTATTPPGTPVHQPWKHFSPLMVATGAAVAIAALLAIFYFWILPRQNADSAQPAAAIEDAGVGGASAQTAHPLAKHLELTGIRITEVAGGSASIQMLVVNHSGADLPNLIMDVTLTAGGREIFQFPVKLPSIGPYEARELSSKVKTDLKPYELPDWEVVRSEFRLRSEP